MNIDDTLNSGNSSMDNFFNSEDDASETPNQDMQAFFDDKAEVEEDFSDEEESTVYIDESEFSEDELVNFIVDKCCGKEESGYPKSAVTLAYEKMSLDYSSRKTIREIFSHKPEIQIQKRLEFIQVDVIFNSAVDSDLKVMWNTFERFGRDLNRLSDESKEIPYNAFTIVPVSENGKYYIVCTNPFLWVLQPSIQGGSINTIRVLYRAEDMTFYESDEVNMTDIEAAAMRTLQDRERQTATLYEKQQAERDYQEERNRQLEEMRRKGLN